MLPVIKYLTCGSIDTVDRIQCLSCTPYIIFRNENNICRWQFFKLLTGIQVFHIQCTCMISGTFRPRPAVCALNFQIILLVLIVYAMYIQTKTSCANQPDQVFLRFSFVRWRSSLSIMIRRTYSASGRLSLKRTLMKVSSTGRNPRSLARSSS